jgi:hypothetical protein
MSRLPLPVLVAGVLLASSGCAGKMTRVTRAIRRYEALLRLDVTPGTMSPVIGEALDLTLTLSNVGDVGTDSVEACLGHAEEEYFVAVPLVPRGGKQPLSGTVDTIDHPRCERRFQLGPGEQLRWHKSILVPDLGEGEADLKLSIQIVHPRDCDRYGCYDTMLTAQPVRLSLQGAS